MAAAHGITIRVDNAETSLRNLGMTPVVLGSTRLATISEVLFRSTIARRGFVFAALAWLPLARAQDAFQFVLLGDRTGSVQPGVYERVWRLVAEEKPSFVLSVGDSIEGTNDATAEAEWREFIQILQPFKKISLYLAPGNHDVWSTSSERLYERYSGHPLHYSFDYKQAHFTVLDNSRSDELAPGELAFLEADLKAHAAQPLKIIVSHRPSWLINAALGNPDFPLHRLAKQYGVRYVVAGHVHQILHIELDGVTYLSLPSAGGHLRLSGAYQDGWFFGYSLVRAEGVRLKIQVKEAPANQGEGRVTQLADWGMAGLVKKTAAAK
jgi:3',5'-cyclic-AMP phosphodiesterase